MPEICLQIIKNRVATSKILKPFKLLKKSVVNSQIHY